MRPVRFVALSEDGQAFVLADEVGRLLTLPIDERVQSAMRIEQGGGGPGTLVVSAPAMSTLSPRDIQARIRAGESADDVARIAGVPVDRVLRYAGPVLQERAMRRKNTSAGMASDFLNSGCGGWMPQTRRAPFREK